MVPRKCVSTIHRQRKNIGWNYCRITLLLFLLSVPHLAAADAHEETIPRPSDSRKSFDLNRKDKHGHEGKVARATRHYRTLKKPAVKSIQSPDGDVIDCVLRERQPAFDHPLLQNSSIQDPPSSLMFSTLKSTQRQVVDDAMQLWRKSGSCPFGTIPIRRTEVRDLLRVGSSTRYGRKTHKPPRRPRAGTPSAMDGSGHEHAIAFVEGDRYYGAKAVLSVWDPVVEVANEFSLSQMWILGGSFDGDLNSIEAGWQVSPELYGDKRPRLFTYWTSDSYQATGCYNLLCSGFIQTNEAIALGASIAPVSTYGSDQYQIEIMVWKDPREGNWWMVFEQSVIVGYWPASLFSHLSDHASMIEWGGEVVNSMPGGRHTSTQMGSGRFAEEGFGSASFFHSLQTVDADNNLQPVGNIRTLAEHPNCYNIRSLEDPNWGTSFYYGGPGRNPLCP